MSTPGEVEDGTYDSVDELVRRERRRKWMNLAAAGAALVATGLWVWWLETARARARDFGALADAYTYGQGVGAMLMAALAGAITCISKRRSWFRFLATYAIVMVMLLTSAARRNERRLQPVPPPTEAPEVDLMRRQALLDKDYQVYARRLKAHPPFSPEGLQSVQAIDASLNTLVNVTNILDLKQKLNRDVEASVPNAKTPASKQVHELLDVRKQDYELSRKMLEFLRSHFGHWTLTEQGISFEEQALHEQFNGMMAEAGGLARRIEHLQRALEATNAPLN